MEVHAHAPVSQGFDHTNEGEDHPVPVDGSAIQEGIGRQQDGHLRLHMNSHPYRAASVFQERANQVL